jgi:hypothetical protein
LKVPTVFVDDEDDDETKSITIYCESDNLLKYNLQYIPKKSLSNSRSK